MEHKIEEDIDIADGEVTHSSNTAEDFEFDTVVGALEEVVMNDEFQDLQADFCERYCDKFEESKENKLEYTSVFNEYTDILERMIEMKLKEKIPGYSIPKMDSLLRRHRQDLSGEVFDLLSSLTDFNDFKELMLQTKRNKVSDRGLDLSITGHHM